MAFLGWLNDSHNHTLWISVIYPLLIILLTVLCHLRMTRLIQDLPLATEESVGRRENESSAAQDTSSADYDIISQPCAGDVTEIEALLDETSPVIEGPKEGVTVSEEKRSGQKCSKPATEGTSRLHQSEFFKSALIFSTQLFLAHRLGWLAMTQVRETHYLEDKLKGLVAIGVVTAVLLMSFGPVGDARALSLRRYRRKDGLTAPTDPTDHLTKYFLFSFLALVVPWFRILSSLPG